MDSYEAQARLAQYKSGGGGGRDPRKLWLTILYVVIPVAFAVGPGHCLYVLRKGG
jgi:hypothetical protein